LLFKLKSGGNTKGKHGLPCFPEAVEKVALPLFRVFSALACSFLTVSQSCKETLATQGFSLAPYTPPLTIESSGAAAPDPHGLLF